MEDFIKYMFFFNLFWKAFRQGREKINKLSIMDRNVNFFNNKNNGINKLTSIVPFFTTF